MPAPVWVSAQDLAMPAPALGSAQELATPAPVWVSAQEAAKRVPALGSVEAYRSTVQMTLRRPQQPVHSASWTIWQLENSSRPRIPLVPIEIASENKHQVDVLAHVAFYRYAVGGSAGDSMSNKLPQRRLVQRPALRGEKLFQVTEHPVLKLTHLGFGECLHLSFSDRQHGERLARILLYRTLSSGLERGFGRVTSPVSAAVLFVRVLPDSLNSLMFSLESSSVQKHSIGPNTVRNSPGVHVGKYTLSTRGS